VLELLELLLLLEDDIHAIKGEAGNVPDVGGGPVPVNV
jgi:hypothetical protein